MPLIARLASLVRTLTARERLDRELDAELRATFELLIDERIRAGDDPQAARRAARLELGVSQSRTASSHSSTSSSCRSTSRDNCSVAAMLSAAMSGSTVNRTPSSASCHRRFRASTRA
jgi:hypothetical protein